MNPDPNESIDLSQGATSISQRYGSNVLISLGAAGAVVATGQETFIIKNPQVEAISAVGSGDCMLAGLTYGILHGYSVKEASICGVAAGTANTLSMGAGQFRLDDFERLRARVHIIPS